MMYERPLLFMCLSSPHKGIKLWKPQSTMNEGRAHNKNKLSDHGITLSSEALFDLKAAPVDSVISL